MELLPDSVIEAWGSPHRDHHQSIPYAFLKDPAPPQCPSSPSRSLADGNSGRDLVLDVDDAIREDLGEFLGHVLVLDGPLQSGEHRLGELGAGFDCADARVLAELLGDVVDEVLAVRELTVGPDSHDPLVHTRC